MCGIFALFNYKFNNYTNCDYDYNIDYIDLKVIYDRALAVKEDRLEEYQRQMDEDWDDYNHAISMIM